MRDLITVELIQARDTEGLVSDSTSLADAITRVSYYVCNQVGHDFGDSTAVDEILEGPPSPYLRLHGKTQYPLRSLTAIEIDDVDVDISSDTLFYKANPRIGNVITELRLKGVNWNGYEVKITGDWGWTAVPDDVKEAIYRLLVLEITGTPYGRRRTASSSVYGSGSVKRVKQPDGIEVEFSVPQASEILTTYTSGDDFADEVIDRYRWAASGGVV